MVTSKDYTPANVSHSDLLKYHLQISARTDAERERKEALKTLHLLDNPPVYDIHQHAEISHDAQKFAVNPNNALVNARVKKDLKAIQSEKPKEPKAKVVEDFKHLTTEEVEQQKTFMHEQIKNAANRKTDEPSWVPQSVNVKPVEAQAATSAIQPPWLPQTKG